jgi:hypothetical protein
MTYRNNWERERTGRSPSEPHLRKMALLLAILTSCVGCNAALIGAGVAVVGLGAAALAYSCDEPVGVDIWDRRTAHSLCDAAVTAESEGHLVHFSPCYQGYLGDGTWTVTATKSGYRPSSGTVVILHGHRCGEPAYHSIELTLVPEGEEQSLPPVLVTPPEGVPVPAAAPQGSSAPPAVEPPLPAPAAPAPSSSVPTQAFPSASAPQTK